MKAFTFSQFGYCQLVWMFHSRRLCNRLNNIHERALRIIYRDRIRTFEKLLKKSKSATIQRNLQILATESFNTKKGLNPEIMKNIFNFVEPAYHLRSKQSVRKTYVKSIRYGTKTISHLGPKIWNFSQEEIDSLSIFKRKFQIGKQINVLVDYTEHI